MTAAELIAELRVIFREAGPQDVRVIFHYLANRVIEARLAEGQRITDVTDVEAWLRELAEAARVSGVSHICDSPAAAGELRTWAKAAHPPAQRRWNDTCPRCGHIRQFCRCELEVPA